MNWVGALRAELYRRAKRWARAPRLKSYQSLGKAPTILFEPTSNDRRHGNFMQSSWREIRDNANWRVRLSKAHSQLKALPALKRDSARELDSSNSSDALLMNCFCFPRASSRLLSKLSLPAQGATPEFGFMARLRLRDGSVDETEIDMKLGSLLVEAKLTEKDFAAREFAHVGRYVELETVFVTESLPRKSGMYMGYQLIRNVLAARQHDANLCVFLDQRRPDLLQEWWAVHAAIRDAGLRARCGLRTWQQVRAVSPPALARFLRAKYGL